MKASASITKGAGSLNHNRRKFLTDNVDKDRVKDDIILIDRDIKMVYEEVFGEALEKYNAKQKRNDRIIKSYYDKISRSKQEKPFYELIIQLGNKDNSKELNDIVSNILTDMVNSIINKYPNIIVIGAYIHNDEATPHLHLDYIPIAHSKNRGLELKNSNNLAMKEMGYSDYKVWREDLMNDLISISNQYGVERKIMNNENKHLSVKEYKEVMQEVDYAQNHLQNLKKEIVKRNESITELDNEIYKKENYEPYWQRMVDKIVWWLEAVLKIKIPFIEHYDNNTYRINETILDSELERNYDNPDYDDIEI